jgi:uncharacterized protein YuzE
MKKSKIYYDKENDALYLNLREGKEAYFEEIEPNVIVEYNEKNQPLAVEILNASLLFKKISSFNIPMVYDKNRIYKPSSK